MSLSPIPSRCCSKLRAGKVLVNRSTMLFADAIFSTETSPLLTISLTRWNFRSMCFPLRLFLGSLALATAPLLSQYSLIGSCIFGTTFSSFKNSRSQTTSLAASQAATYSTSMVESATQVCLTLLHIMVPPPKVKTAPEVDFRESLSYWKSESVYPIGINSLPEYTNI